MPQKPIECFRLLFDHLAWIEHQFLSGIRDSRKAGSLWGMMRGVGGVRKSIHQSWLAKGLGLGLLCWGFKGVQEEIPWEESTLFKSGLWNFHQDNTPVHNSIFVTDYLTKMGIKTVPLPPYSPDLETFGYSLSSEVKEAVMKVIDTLTQKDIYLAFQKNGTSALLWRGLNKSWRQHPTRHQLYGHLPPITKTIQVRRTRHAGHCCRSKDELISDVLLWTPTYGQAKAGRPTRTYIQQLCDDTGCNPENLPESMNNREKWRDRIWDIRVSGTTWWWWWQSIKVPIRKNSGNYFNDPHMYGNKVYLWFKCVVIIFVSKWVHLKFFTIYFCERNVVWLNITSCGIYMREHFITN